MHALAFFTYSIFSSVNLKQYATGQSLLEAGAVSGHDMTVECAAIKLGYLMVGFLMEAATLVALMNYRGWVFLRSKYENLWENAYEESSLKQQRNIGKFEPPPRRGTHLPYRASRQGSCCLCQICNLAIRERPREDKQLCKVCYV